MNLIYEILGNTSQDGPIRKKMEPKSSTEKQILSYRKYKERKLKYEDKNKTNPTAILLGTKKKNKRAMVLPEGLKSLERNASTKQGENPKTEVSPTI